MPTVGSGKSSVAADAIQVLVDGDFGPFGKAIAGLGRNFAGALQGISKGVAIALAAGAVIGGTLLLTVRKALGAFALLDAAMREIATLSPSTADALSAVRKQIELLSEEVAQTPADLASGLYQVISAGFTDQAQALEVLRVSAKVATAGITDTRTAVDSLTTVLNAFGLSATDASRASDILFATVREGKVTFPELAQSIGNVATSAGVAQISLEDTAAAIATLTKFGLNARKATTALNSLLISIVNPTDQVSEAAAELGLQWNEMALRAKGLSGVMRELQAVSNGNADVVAELVPAIRSFRAAAVLAGNGGAEYAAILERITKDVGAADRAFAKINSSFKNQAQIVKNRINNAFAELGAKILPVFTRAIKGVNVYFREQDEALAGIAEAAGTAEGRALGFQIRQEKFIKNSTEALHDQSKALKDIGKDWKELIGYSTGILNVFDQMRLAVKETLGVVTLTSNWGDFFNNLEQVNIGSNLREAARSIEEYQTLLENSEIAFKRLNEERERLNKLSEDDSPASVRVNSDEWLAAAQAIGEVSDQFKSLTGEQTTAAIQALRDANLLSEDTAGALAVQIEKLTEAQVKLLNISEILEETVKAAKLDPADVNEITRALEGQFAVDAQIIKQRKQYLEIQQRLLTTYAELNPLAAKLALADQRELKIAETQAAISRLRGELNTLQGVPGEFAEKSRIAITRNIELLEASFKEIDASIDTEAQEAVLAIQRDLMQNYEELIPLAEQLRTEQEKAIRTAETEKKIGELERTLKAIENLPGDLAEQARVTIESNIDLLRDSLETINVDVNIEQLRALKTVQEALIDTYERLNPIAAKFNTTIREDLDLNATRIQIAELEKQLVSISNVPGEIAQKARNTITENIKLLTDSMEEVSSAADREALEEYLKIQTELVDTYKELYPLAAKLQTVEDRELRIEQTRAKIALLNDDLAQLQSVPGELAEKARTALTANIDLLQRSLQKVDFDIDTESLELFIDLQRDLVQNFKEVEPFASRFSSQLERDLNLAETELKIKQLKSTLNALYEAPTLEGVNQTKSALEKELALLDKFATGSVAGEAAIKGLRLAVKAFGTEGAESFEKQRKSIEKNVAILEKSVKKQQSSLRIFLSELNEWLKYFDETLGGLDTQTSEFARRLQWNIEDLSSFNKIWEAINSEQLTFGEKLVIIGVESVAIVKRYKEWLSDIKKIRAEVVKLGNYLDILSTASQDFGAIPEGQLRGLERLREQAAIAELRNDLEKQYARLSLESAMVYNDIYVDTRKSLKEREKAIERIGKLGLDEALKQAELEVDMTSEYTKRGRIAREQAEYFAASQERQIRWFQDRARLGKNSAEWAELEKKYLQDGLVIVAKRDIAIERINQQYEERIELIGKINSRFAEAGRRSGTEREQDLLTIYKEIDDLKERLITAEDDVKTKLERNIRLLERRAEILRTSARYELDKRAIDLERALLVGQRDTREAESQRIILRGELERTNLWKQRIELLEDIKELEIDGLDIVKEKQRIILETNKDIEASNEKQRKDLKYLQLAYDERLATINQIIATRETGLRGPTAATAELQRQQALLQIAVQRKQIEYELDTLEGETSQEYRAALNRLREELTKTEKYLTTTDRFHLIAAQQLLDVQAKLITGSTKLDKIRKIRLETEKAIYQVAVDLDENIAAAAESGIDAEVAKQDAIIATNRLLRDQNVQIANQQALSDEQRKTFERLMSLFKETGGDPNEAAQYAQVLAVAEVTREINELSVLYAESTGEAKRIVGQLLLRLLQARNAQRDLGRFQAEYASEWYQLQAEILRQGGYESQQAAELLDLRAKALALQSKFAAELESATGDLEQQQRIMQAQNEATGQLITQWVSYISPLLGASFQFRENLANAVSEFQKLNNLVPELGYEGLLQPFMDEYRNAISETGGDLATLRDDADKYLRGINAVFQSTLGKTLGDMRELIRVFAPALDEAISRAEYLATIGLNRDQLIEGLVARSDVEKAGALAKATQSISDRADKARKDYELIAEAAENAGTSVDAIIDELKKTDPTLAAEFQAAYEAAQKTRDETEKLVDDMAAVVRAALQFAQAIGDVPDDILRAASALAEVGINLAQGLTAVEGFTTGNWLGVAGGAVNFLGALFGGGPSEEELEAQRIWEDILDTMKENNRSLRRLRESMEELADAFSTFDFQAARDFEDLLAESISKATDDLFLREQQLPYFPGYGSQFPEFPAPDTWAYKNAFDRLFDKDILDFLSQDEVLKYLQELGVKNEQQLAAVVDDLIRAGGAFVAMADQWGYTLTELEDLAQEAGVEIPAIKEAWEQWNTTGKISEEVALAAGYELEKLNEAIETLRTGLAAWLKSYEGATALADLRAEVLDLGTTAEDSVKRLALAREALQDFAPSLDALAEIDNEKLRKAVDTLFTADVTTPEGRTALDEAIRYIVENIAQLPADIFGKLNFEQFLNLLKDTEGALDDISEAFTEELGDTSFQVFRGITEITGNRILGVMTTDTYWNRISALNTGRLVEFFTGENPFDVPEVANMTVIGLTELAIVPDQIDTIIAILKDIAKYSDEITNNTGDVPTTEPDLTPRTPLEPVTEQPPFGPDLTPRFYPTLDTTSADLFADALRPDAENQLFALQTLAEFMEEMLRLQEDQFLESPTVEAIEALGEKLGGFGGETIIERIDITVNVPEGTENAAAFGAVVGETLATQLDRELKRRTDTQSRSFGAVTKRTA